MGYARFSGREARDVVEVRHDLHGLDEGGFWAVVVTFEGGVTCVRFGDVRPAPSRTQPSRTQPSRAKPSRAKPSGAQSSRAQPSRAIPSWKPLEGEWTSSLDRPAYQQGVGDIRRRIAAGDVYQVNLCRILAHPLDNDADLAGLESVVGKGNPAPHAAFVQVPEADLDIVCASPEAFLLRRGGHLASRPIKGTATTMATMLSKDYAENVMITDLMRNDISHVCRAGSVSVDALCAPETHPGLVHLVSTVSGTLRAGVTWEQIAEATFPPGSVSGAPKSSALRAIAALETEPRGPYCGAIGWVDADRGEAALAVGIRSFWAGRDLSGSRMLRFGTGAGITWGSDPAQEWAETQLKAARLIGLASGRVDV